MKKVLLIIAVCIAGLSAKSQCSELFFSRYIEFGQSNKAFEIYNPTPNPISLTGYIVERYKFVGTYPSGSISTTMNDSLHLKAGAVIPAYGTWVVTNPEITPNSGNSNSVCDTALRVRSNQKGNFYGKYGTNVGDPTYFKGNDALVLRNPAGNIVDIFGEVGQSVKFWSTSPSYRGGVSEGTWVSKYYLLERKQTVTSGVTSFPSQFIVLASWDTIPLIWPNASMTRQDTVDTYNLFGTTHSCTCFVGIQKNEKSSKVSVYPNPVSSGSVTVSSTEIISEVKLFNISGQLILTESAINKMQCSVNTDKVAKGTYMLLVSFKNGFTERKNLTIE